MEIFSLKLIEQEIKRLEFKSQLAVQEQVTLHRYRKELALLKKIATEVNMSGDYDEFMERLSIQNVYMIEPDVYEYMLESACKISEISNIRKE